MARPVILHLFDFPPFFLKQVKNGIIFVAVDKPRANTVFLASYLLYFDSTPSIAHGFDYGDFTVTLLFQLFGSGKTWDTCSDDDNIFYGLVFVLIFVVSPVREFLFLSAAALRNHIFLAV
jgi:hypothetical protein